MKPLVVALLLTLAGPALAAGAQTPPFELDLPSGPIELVLDDCQIDVLVEAGAQPSVRAFPAPGAAGSPPGFEISGSGGGTRIVIADGGAPPDAATVVLELVLDAHQALDLRGGRLSVSSRNPVPIAGGRKRVPGDAQGDTAEPKPESGLQSYDLVDSEISLLGAANVSLLGVNTVAHVQDGSGDLSLDLERGSLSLVRHRGMLRLTARDSTSSVHDLEGGADLELEGGDLELADGVGSIQGRIGGGGLRVDHWTGSTNLTAEDAMVELRDSSLSQTTLTTQSSELVLDGVEGAVRAQVNGGGLTAEQVRGRLEVTAGAGARVEIDDHDGGVVVTASDDAVVEASNVDDALTATVSDAELRLSGAGSLELTARRARLTISNVARIRTLDARQCELDLDISTIESNSLDLRVVDGSSATVVVPSPCRVQLRESTDAAQQVDVTGCEFQMQNMGHWRGSQVRSLDGRPAFMLTAKISEGSSLRVSGAP